MISFTKNKNLERSERREEEEATATDAVEEEGTGAGREEFCSSEDPGVKCLTS